MLFWKCSCVRWSGGPPRIIFSLKVLAQQTLAVSWSSKNWLQVSPNLLVSRNYLESGQDRWSIWIWLARSCLGDQQGYIVAFGGANLTATSKASFVWEHIFFLLLNFYICKQADIKIPEKILADLNGNSNHREDMIRIGTVPRGEGFL